MIKILYNTLLLISLGVILNSCLSGINKSTVIPEKPYERLSQYQFFKGKLADLMPNDRVIPYDLNSPLFSDYAQKARFVWMPEGTSAQYKREGVLDFPENTVLIKNFYYEIDERDVSKGKNIIETRLLIHRGAEWEAVGYIWNSDQSEAYLEIIGDIQEISWVDKSGSRQNINYIIPNKNQCKSCHLKGKQQIPIGPKVQNLNRTFVYAEGEMHQLAKWASVGYLTGFDPAIKHSKVATWNDEMTGTLHDRAMAYLDINCGHCHNKEGSANTSGLHLLSDAKLDMALGIYKATVSAGAGTGGNTYSIVPGNPEESIMVYRMKSTNPGAMMPELGRTVVHHEGVGLISDWIVEMGKNKTIQASAKLQ